jgi:hypothetical protein
MVIAAWAAGRHLRPSATIRQRTPAPGPWRPGSAAGRRFSSGRYGSRPIIARPLWGLVLVARLGVMNLAGMTARQDRRHPVADEERMSLVALDDRELAY